MAVEGNEFLSSLPADLQGNAELAAFKSGEELARGFLDTKKPFQERLPDDIRANPTLSTLKSVEEMARSLINTKALVGNKRARPADDAPPEQWEAFHTDMGRPGKAEDYKFELPKELDPKLVDPELLNGFKTMAYEAGLTPKDAQNMVTKYSGLLLGKIQAGIAAQGAAREAAEGQLKKEWGDNYEANRGLIKQVLRTFMTEEIKAAIDHGPGSLFPDLPEKPGDGVFNNPLLARMLLKVGQAMGEGVLQKEDLSEAGAEGLEAERKKLMQSPAYFDESHADHQKVVDQVKAIYAKLHREPVKK